MPEHRARRDAVQEIDLQDRLGRSMHQDRDVPLQDLRPDVVSGRGLHLPVHREGEHFLRGHPLGRPQRAFHHDRGLHPLVIEQEVDPLTRRQVLLHRSESLDRSSSVAVQPRIDDARVPGGRVHSQDDHQAKQDQGQGRPEGRVLEAREGQEQDRRKQSHRRDQRQRTPETERRDRQEPYHQVREDDPEREKDHDTRCRAPQHTRPLPQEGQGRSQEERRGERQGQGRQRRRELRQARSGQERRELQVEQGDLGHQVHRGVGPDRRRTHERGQGGEWALQAVGQGGREEDSQGEGQEENRPGRGASPERAPDEERQRPVPQEKEAPGDEREQGHRRPHGSGPGGRDGRRVVHEARALRGDIGAGQGGADRPRTFQAAVLPQQDAPRRRDSRQRQPHQEVSPDAERRQDQGSRNRQTQGAPRHRQTEGEAETQPDPFRPGGDEARQDRNRRAVERRRQGEHPGRKEQPQPERAHCGVSQDRPQDQVQGAREAEDADRDQRRQTESRLGQRQERHRGRRVPAAQARERGAQGPRDRQNRDGGAGRPGGEAGGEEEYPGGPHREDRGGRRVRQVEGEEDGRHHEAAPYKGGPGWAIRRLGASALAHRRTDCIIADA